MHVLCCYKQTLLEIVGPVVLLVVHSAAKVLLECLVGPFGLSICLGVES
jgi:hypothetical protein